MEKILKEKKRTEPKYSLWDVTEAWGNLGNTGLTIHAICSLTGLSPKDALRELKGENYCVELCSSVGAPVYWFDEYGSADLKYKSLLLFLSEQLLEKYPVKKYKGYDNYRGTLEIMPYRDLVRLETEIRLSREDSGEEDY